MADFPINASVVGEEQAREAVSPQRWWALAVLCLSIVVITIDTTILNVALPSLVRSLHASASQLQWIVDAYTVVFASLLLTAGSLGDRFGRLGALNVGMAVLAVGSVGSALAGSPAQLIATRAVTGIGAALVFPATLSLLTNIFPNRVERQRAIAIWAGASGIGIGLGPVAGGLLLRSFYWGSVFWVNVPVCLFALIAARMLVPNSRDPRRSPLDPPGAAVSVLGLSALVYAIIEGPVSGWASASVVAAFAAAAALLAGFAVTEVRRTHPMLDVRLFTNPRFSAASLAITALFFGLTGIIFFQTQHLQFVLGYDVLGAGLRSAPLALALLVVSPVTPRFVRLVGTRAVVTAGLVTGAVAMAARATFSVRTGYDAILITQCLLGLGVALTLAAATASIMGAVGRERAGVGSAVNDTTRQVGGALGVAVMGSVGATLYRHDLVQRLSGTHLAAAASAKALNSVGTALQVASRLPGPTGQDLADAARRAFIHGSNAAALVGAAVAAAAALLASRFLPAGMRVGAPASAAKSTTTEHAAVDPIRPQVIQLT
jgi:EmrB/QacA subfamily drug resistance transporter